MKRTISVLLALIMTATLVLSVFTGSVGAMTGTELRAAINAKNTLSGLMTYYDRYLNRVTLDENLSNSEFIRYRDVLIPAAHALLEQKEYELASVYQNMEYALEDCWQTWRLSMPVSRGIDSFWETAKESVPDTFEGYTNSAVMSFNGAYACLTQRIADLGNSTVSRDITGEKAVGKLSSALSEMQLKNGAPEHDCIVASAAEQDLARAAKDTLAAEIDSLQTLVDAIPETDTSVYAERARTEYALLRALTESDTLYVPESYMAYVPGGLYWLVIEATGECVNTDAYLRLYNSFISVVVDRYAYNTASFSTFINYYNNGGKNLADTLYTGTFSDASDSVNSFIASARTVSYTSAHNAQYQARQGLIRFMSAVAIQADRDTKQTLSPETVRLLDALQEGVVCVSDYSSRSVSEIAAVQSNIEYVCERVFQPALPVGTPFQKKARALYFTYADKAANYSVDSWDAVVNAMNDCDYIKNDGFDFECEAAYSALADAISKLELREDVDVTFTVSEELTAADGTVTVSVSVDDNIGFTYGHFYLYYDTSVFKYVSSTCQEVTVGSNGLLFKPDFTVGLTEAQAVFTVTFDVADDAYAGNYVFDLECEKVRDVSRFLFKQTICIDGSVVIGNFAAGDINMSGGVDIADALALFKHVAGISLISDTASLALADVDGSATVDIADALAVFKHAAGIELIEGAEGSSAPSSATVSFDNDGSARVTAARGSVVGIPDDPEKDGYIFEGWLDEAGETLIGDKIIAGADSTYTASWKEFIGGTVKSDELLIAGYVAVFSQYAVEEDYKLLHDCGVDLVILDWYHNDETVYAQNLRWAEKYGIRAWIYDGTLNAEGWTASNILTYTASYRDSKSFVGNFLRDEPGYNEISAYAEMIRVYQQVLPGYDVHVNNFPFTDYVQSYVNQTSGVIVSYDPYPLSSSVYGDRLTASDYYSVLRACTTAAEADGSTSCVYIQSMSGMDNRVITLADLRFQMYASLAFGNSIIMHYCYETPGFNGTPTPSGTVYALRDSMRDCTILWDYAQTANTEVKAFAEYIESLEHVDTRAIYSSSSPAYVRSISRYNAGNISCDGELLVGLFEDGQTTKGYLVANATELSDETAVTVTFNASGCNSVKLIVGGKITVPELTPEGTFTFTLSTGNGAYIVTD